MTSKFLKKWQLFKKSFSLNTCCHGMVPLTLRLAPVPAGSHQSPNIFFRRSSATHSKGTSQQTNLFFSKIQ